MRGFCVVPCGVCGGFLVKFLAAKKKTGRKPAESSVRLSPHFSPMFANILSRISVLGTTRKSIAIRIEDCCTACNCTNLAQKNDMQLCLSKLTKKNFPSRHHQIRVAHPQDAARCDWILPQGFAGKDIVGALSQARGQLDELFMEKGPKLLHMGL